jgi:hypothetical protein
MPCAEFVFGHAYHHPPQCASEARVDEQGALHFGQGRGMRGRPPLRTRRAACILRAVDFESLRITTLVPQCGESKKSLVGLMLRQVLRA